MDKSIISGKPRGAWEKLAKKGILEQNLMGSLPYDEFYFNMPSSKLRSLIELPKTVEVNTADFCTYAKEILAENYPWKEFGKDFQMKSVKVNSLIPDLVCLKKGKVKKIIEINPDEHKKMAWFDRDMDAFIGRIANDYVKGIVYEKSGVEYYVIWTGDEIKDKATVENFVKELFKVINNLSHTVNQ